MRAVSHGRSALIGAALAALAGAPAVADVIDGDWCHDDGRRMSIRGPAIVTPGGTRLEGDYTRHSFHYVAPAGEPDGGQPVDMLLRSETRVDVRTGREAAPQTWHRCTATTS